MRDYQVQGLNWMISLYHNGINGILADEMVRTLVLHLPAHRADHLVNFRVSERRFRQSPSSAT